jgi:16S rRNA processing protein RimM
LTSDNADYLTAGKVSGVFGIKGAVKVFSFTDPRENILRYSPWILQKQGQVREIRVTGGQRQGNVVVAALEGIDDRDAAQALMGSDVLILRQQLPPPELGEYYWTDLIGLAVENESGIKLGQVTHLLETGANDVLVVNDCQTERLIPFLQPQVVMCVDLDKGLIQVNWDPEF